MANNEETEMSSKTEDFTYAISKLDVATEISASYLSDSIQAYNLGFIGTTYTAAHEGMELLLKVYLKWNMGKDVRGHDLGKLFMQWDEQGRTKTELAYQNGVWRDLMMNRISRSVQIENHRLITANRKQNMRTEFPSLRSLVENISGTLGE